MSNKSKKNKNKGDLSKVGGRSVSGQGSVDVPAGHWTDVRIGQRIAEGVYVDSEGVLRDCDDHSVVVNHHKCRDHGHCDRRGIQPHEIIYDTRFNNAPWCPDCFDTHVNCKNRIFAALKMAAQKRGK